jgi:hypothetical protein
MLAAAYSISQASACLHCLYMMVLKSCTHLVQGSDGAICAVANDDDVAAGMPPGLLSGVAAVHNLLTRLAVRWH